jgi:uncharacterized protein (TIGR02996 family)
MNHHQAFLQDILEHPDDDAPRLIYADWLDDHDDPDRAEFIRAQCALAGMEDDDERRWALLAREQALLWAHGKEWARPVRHLVKRWRFRRGFVEGVALSADAFLRHAEELLSVAPIRQVRLSHMTDRLYDLARCAHLGRLTGLDLRHCDGLLNDRICPLLVSPYVTGLRSLGLRGTGLCTGGGLWTLAQCQRLAGLEALDLGDYRRDAILGRRRFRPEGLDVWRGHGHGNAVDERAMRALVESPHLTRLRSLGLGGYGYWFGPDALRCFLDSRLLARLHELDLSLVRGLDPESEGQPWPGILDLLANSPQAARLRRLRLRKPRGGFHPGPYLRQLRTLEVDDWSLSAAPVATLCNGSFAGLTTLRLRGAGFHWRRHSPEAARLAAQFLATRGLPRLAVLDLHQTILGPEAVRVLAESPLLGQLSWLSLSNRSGVHSRPVGWEAAHRLVTSPHAARLVHLDLSNNDLGDPVAYSLANSPHLGGLLSLNLWHNQIGSAGAGELATAVNLPSLQTVDLRSNPITSRVVLRELRQRFGAGVRYGRGPRLTDDAG